MRPVIGILADTPLHGLMGCEEMQANSFHHQAIKELGQGLAVMAVAADGQNRSIFEDFIHACRHRFF